MLNTKLPNRRKIGWRKRRFMDVLQEDMQRAGVS